MKSIMKKILDIPTKYTTIACSGLILLILMMIKGEITSLMTLLIVTFSFLIVLYMNYGKVVIKAILSMIAVVYMSSIYTSFVIITDSKAIEPFLLSLASSAAFLSITYNHNKYNYGLRNRALWVTIITIVVVAAKTTIIALGFSFIIAEIIGLNVLTLLAALWLIWVNNSKKTKIVEPLVEKIEDIGKLKFVHIKNTFDYKDKKWIGFHFDKKSNAYPYIFNESLKCESENKMLVIVSSLKTSREYDIGEIPLNRSKSIFYLYMEAKENIFSEEIIEKFIEESSRAKC